MGRGLLASLTLFSLLILLAPPATAADKPAVEQHTPDAAISHGKATAIGAEQAVTTGPPRALAPRALGTVSATLSPGKAIGYTWYDYQHSGSMGRMVETAFGTRALVHFAWMFMPGPALELREYDYFDYDLTNSLQGTVTGLQPDDESGGYVGLTTTNDNRAVVGGNVFSPIDGRTAPQIYWDFGEGTAFFGTSARVPQAVAEYGGNVGGNASWPKFRYVEGPTDTVLHVIAQGSPVGGGDPGPIYYFRRVGGDTDPFATWTYPPYVVDSVYTDGNDIAATDDGKVALVWTANLPCSAADPDTASGYECRNYVQQDNDVYYQISNDYGVTWQPRVNLTRYITTEGTDSYRAYADVSALIDSNDDLHIAWAARAWPAGSENPGGGGQAGLYRGRIFHWSENTGVITTAHSADWDQTLCSPGAWNLNAGKMSVSECNGRFYILFVQINDIPNGVANDCAVTSNPGFPTGAGNGDLYVTVSGDGGVTWDVARDITNSRTPGCDSVGGAGGPCDNDNWPSMARFGTTYALNPGDDYTDVIVPTGGTEDGHYLDVLYVNDHSAGGVVQNEGTWQQADMRWFRLACVAPVLSPNAVLEPTGFTMFVFQCESDSSDFVLWNFGNDDLTYTWSVEEDPGPYAGWLTVSGLDGSVPAGPGSHDLATVAINENLAICSPGQYTRLTGRIIFTSNAPTSPDTLPIVAYMMPLYGECWPDTVSTTCLSLLVDHYGAEGGQGKGGVNMDYVNSGDCDPTADIYLYDGSPVIGWIDGVDTVMNWSIFGQTFNSPVGFFPTDCNATVVDSGYSWYMTTVMTHDSSLALEKLWIAPSDPSFCNFVIQRTRVWSNDGAAHSGITIGEAIDWDIPSDSMSRNGSGFDSNVDLIYQYGAEYHQDDTSSCQDNDLRYGGIKFLAQYSKASDWTNLGSVSGAYTADNPTYVFPNGNFDPGELYAMMQQTGWAAYGSSNPDSQYTDLHTVMTYGTDITIDVGDTLIVYTALITEKNGGLLGLETSAEAAYEWYCTYVISDPPGCSCCQLRGDMDHDGALNVADVTYLVAFLFQGAPPPVCLEEADINGDGEVNISDLTCLVGWLFQGIDTCFVPC